MSKRTTKESADSANKTSIEPARVVQQYISLDFQNEAELWLDYL